MLAVGSNASSSSIVFSLALFSGFGDIEITK
jgi:hypothetical protein